MPPNNKGAVNLSTLPAGWLKKLAIMLSPRDRLQLARTCHNMLQLVLSNHPLHLSLGKGSTPTAVQMACLRSSDVHLVLDCHTLEPKQLLERAAEQLGQDLTAIQRMTLQVGPRHKLKPPILQQTCPNLTNLTLIWTPPGERSHVRSHSYTQVRHLHQQRALQHIQDLLRALPQLQSLTVAQTNQDDEDDVPLASWITCCAAAPQVKHLHLPREDSRLPQPLLRTLNTDFPQLESLRLPGYQLHDADVDVLLATPALRHLQCYGLQLNDSHRNRPCPWTTMALEAFSATAFAHLDLQRLRTLRAVCNPQNPRVMLVGSRHSKDVDGFATLVNACGGVDWTAADIHTASVWIHAAAGDTVPFVQLLASCPVSKLVIWGEVFAAETLLSVAAQLPQAVTSVSFHECCFESGCGRVLLSCLPAHVQQVGFSIEHGGQLQEQELAQLCMAAEHQVSVVVWGGPRRFGDGWAARLQGAMRAVGQRYVTLVDEGNEEQEEGEWSVEEHEAENETYACL